MALLLLIPARPMHWCRRALAGFCWLTGAAWPWWEQGPGAGYRSPRVPSAPVGNCYPFSFGIDCPSSLAISLFLCCSGASSLWLFGDAPGSKRASDVEMDDGDIRSCNSIPPRWEIPSREAERGWAQRVEVCSAPAPAKAGGAGSLPPLSAPSARNSTARRCREPWAREPALPRP